MESNSFSSLEAPQYQPERQIYSVTEITLAIKFSLESEFTQIWIEGEISNLRMPSSGHLYLTIKDKESQIKLVMFRNARSRLKFEPKDGDSIIVKGKITVYEPRGEYQAVVDYMEPKGLGALQLALRQLKEKLSKEGLFDEDHKKAIPLLPRKIGIVTSPTGAAARDMLNVINRRFENMPVLIVPVKVQGDEAAMEIADAIRTLNKMKEVDVIIAGRGGGSIEDLWAFNEEPLARAIFESKIPVVSAVGHEIDYTIADFVADLRAPTPSAAAELIVQNKREMLENIISLNRRLLGKIRSILSDSKVHLRNLSTRKVLLDPLTPIYEKQQRLDEINGRMGRGIANFLNMEKERVLSNQKHLFLLNPINKIKQNKLLISEFEKKLNFRMKHILKEMRNYMQSNMKRLDSVSPLSVLKRGYAVCRTHPGDKLLKDSSKTSVGDLVNVSLSKGKIICAIKEKKD